MAIYIILAVCVLGILVLVNPFRSRPTYGRGERASIKSGWSTDYNG